jgi:hypothetical protein
MMLNRALLKKAAPIPTEAVMHDWWIALAASAFGQIHFLEAPTLLYRQHDSNDTGARRYGLLSFLLSSNKRAKYKQTLLKKQSQAQAFLSRYENILDHPRQEILKGYLKFENARGYQKIRLMQKYSFYKTGLLRNFFQLISR